MAITKTTINGDYSALQSFLQSSGLFGSVELGENAVTMNDGDGNTLATLANSGAGSIFTAYANASNSAQGNYVNGGQVISAYKCTTGVVLELTVLSNTSYKACVAITKTNNNKIAFVFTTTLGNNAAAVFQNYHCVAWGDSTISANAFTGKASEQTLMCPFCTNANMGDTSYTPNAFWLPFGQYYNMGYGTLTMNGVTYLTNGYWCIKDA